MVIGGRPPKGSLCSLSTAPSPPGVTFVPPVETYEHQGEARPGPNGHPARGISTVSRVVLGLGCGCCQRPLPPTGISRDLGRPSSGPCAPALFFPELQSWGVCAWPRVSCAVSVFRRFAPVRTSVGPPWHPRRGSRTPCGSRVSLGSIALGKDQPHRPRSRCHH